MTESEDRVQEALAAYIEHAEVGWPAPDTSHLSATELERLNDLVGLLDQTGGIAFGESERREPTVTTAGGVQVIAALRDILPAPARVTSDPAVTMISIAGMNVVEGWIVGTFGGRVRVWLLDAEGALASSERWLDDLARVFRLFPDTAALTLVEPDLSSLLVQPEDCAPTIEVPRGSLVGRRYRRPVHPLREALSGFLRELIPYWEPMRGLSEQSTGTIVELRPIARELADKAIEVQVAAGNRARKTNPKRKALTELDDSHAQELAEIVLDVHEGRAEPEDVSDALRRMAAST